MYLHCGRKLKNPEATRRQKIWWDMQIHTERPQQVPSRGPAGQWIQNLASEFWLLHSIIMCFIFDTTTYAGIVCMCAVTSLKPRMPSYTLISSEDNLERLHWESARGDFGNVEYVFLAFAVKRDSFRIWTIAQRSKTAVHAFILKADQTPKQCKEVFNLIKNHEVIYATKQSTSCAFARTVFDWLVQYRSGNTLR